MGAIACDSCVSPDWDHKQELDADIERRYQFAEQLRREAGESPIAKKFRGKGIREWVSLSTWMNKSPNPLLWGYLPGVANHGEGTPVVGMSKIDVSLLG